VVELTRSYRSSPQILRAASDVLRAARQPAQAIDAIRPDGTEPRIRALPTDRDEALAVARAARLAHAPGRPWSDQAVLVRTHAQTVLLAEAFREAGIPHRLRGGAAFLDRPEIRGALRDLRAATGPLAIALADLEATLEPVGSELDLDDELTDDGRRRASERLDALSALVQMGRDYLRLDPMGGADAFARWLVATVQSEGDAGTGADAVDLATFHAAKGLEWTVVHLAGVEDGFVPVAHARTAAARAEEARLLYVAMTRAQRELNVTWAQQRTFGGKVVERRRSPLLDPIVDRSDGPAPDVARAPALAAGDDFAAEVARRRADLARGRRPVVPGLDALHRWRDAAARAARIEPVAVLPDHVLARVATARPRNVDELARIRGVGTILAGRLGPAMLEALHEPAEPGGAG
jgi:DNA helicase-2/ATP-dependent DNA helicase PcrA